MNTICCSFNFIFIGKATQPDFFSLALNRKVDPILNHEKPYRMALPTVKTFTDRFCKNHVNRAQAATRLMVAVCMV